MTNDATCGILLDSDGSISYHYVKDGVSRRKVLLKADRRGRLSIKDPGTGQVIPVGSLAQVGTLLVLVLESR